MAASSKFDLSSGSPDRPLYSSGQRGSYASATFERSGSFRDRETMENPILSSLPSMSRSSSSITQGDVMSFFHCLRFDPKLVAQEHKLHRSLELRRNISAALGISPDDSTSASLKGKLLPPSTDELKRVKAVIRESSSKARERTKMFSEALSVLNKCFPSIPSRKRSRSDSMSSDRSNAFLSSDRSVLGVPGMGKMGTTQNNIAISSNLEHEQQKSEDRTKSTVPNKRTRTSLVDVRMDARSNTNSRPSGAVDREKEMVRLANTGTVQSEDRTLALGDGWEKSKMKKKRSGIKLDVATITTSGPTKLPNDGYREQKQGMQQRLAIDTRSRLNDSHGCRPGVANVAVGVGKSEGVSQQSTLGMRSSVPRGDSDSSSLLNDRRDRPTSDKERVNLRTVNKANVREDISSASPTSSTKINTSARAPRSASGAVPKLSPNVQRATVPSDWDLSHTNANKVPAIVGNNSRRPTASTRSSSPPVAQWAGQRPQKISRTARRTHFVPIVSGNDETPNSDTISDVTGNESGLAIARRMSGNSPQQVKLKIENFSTAGLSESEESGAAETKSKDKGKKADDMMDEKSGQNGLKLNLMQPSRKNSQLVCGDEIGNGIRRQGRTGRIFTSTRSLMPITIEKVGTAKQLRSSRLGFDKTDSKAGRPPSRKLSDRKPYSRQKHTTLNAMPDFPVGSDDGQEELLAAANAVINPSHANTFWRQMERLFGFLYDADISNLKQQGTRTVPNGIGLVRPVRDMEFVTEAATVDIAKIPLCQRLIAALISEEEIEDYSNSGYEDLSLDLYESGFEVQTDLKSNSLNHRLLGNFQIAGCTAFTGYRITASRRAHDELSQDESDISNFGHSLNGLVSDEATMPSLACPEVEYDNMSMDERLYLEIQSIGIFPEPEPEIAQTVDEEISEEIRRLEAKYDEQVSRTRVIDKLLKHATETRVLQEKEFEERALDKLVTMAYEKYMSCNASAGKSASSKMAKQAASAFVKRTLDRCHMYEETGKSCFSESLFMDMFLSGLSNLNDAQSVDTVTEAESSKPRSPEVRVPAPVGSIQSSSMISRSGQNVDSHDIYSSPAQITDQVTGKEDTRLNRAKTRELLLDDIGGTVGNSLNTPSGIGSSLPSSTKGKRSERDREGKGVLSRNGTAKIGRPALSNIKGERKTKTKPKQKMTQLSASVNGLVGKKSEQSKPTGPKSSEVITTTSKPKEKDELLLEEPLDFSNLQIPEMDVLGVPDDLDGQGQDLDSWLNIDDESFQDHDFMGLEIPMDDLSDLNMMV